MEDMKVNPVGHVILRRTFSEVGRHCPLFESSSYVAAAWAARSLHIKEAQIQFLEQRLRGYEFQLQKSRDNIEGLTARLVGKY
jgi:hypothetical protein